MDISKISLNQENNFSLPVKQKMGEEIVFSPSETSETKEPSPFELFKSENRNQKKRKKLAVNVDPDLFVRIAEALEKKNGWAPVIYAIENRDYELLKFLIDIGEDLEMRTPGTPIYEHYENFSGSTSWTRFHGMEPGFSPLEAAIKNNDKLAIALLFEHNAKNFANMNAVRETYTGERSPFSGEQGIGYVIEWPAIDGKKRQSPLEFAIEQKASKDILELLLNGNIADFNALKDILEKGGSEEMIQKMVEKMKNPVDGFQLAAQYNHPFLFKMLLSKGLIPSENDYKKALQYKSDEIAIHIMEAIGEKNESHWLLQAIDSGRIEVIKGFLDKNLIPETVLEEGKKRCYFLKNFAILEVLLNR